MWVQTEPYRLTETSLRSPPAAVAAAGMARVLQALRRRHHHLRCLPCPSSLSTSSSSPPDPRELLCIDRVLNIPPGGGGQPSQPQHPRAPPHLLHRAAGLTEAESASLLRRLPPPPRAWAASSRNSPASAYRGDEIKAALASDPEGLLSMDPGAGRRSRTRSSPTARSASPPGGGWSSCTRGFLVSTMGFEVRWLVQYPEFLGVNLDRWIIPRHNVVDHLKSVSGLGDRVEMKHYLRFSRRRFYNMFVKPYPACERIFGGMVREREEMVRRQHPMGLWKLFTPVKHERTEEVTNMKLLVGSLR
ncbi:unnamed protein product [Urochloa decumbens]|uniref:Uncharacterized protein n=1 Tax=Urochloa decumbens TaxID=240449 RepID=A0ABC8VYP3_9POAL